MGVRPQSRMAYQDKQAEREFWYQIVVKVIRWKDGYSLDKISPVEWKTYCQRMISINITRGKDKTIQRLKKLEEVIRNNNGFEK